MNILVTGASRGIGKAIANKLITEGHEVFVSARNEELLKDSYKRYLENKLREAFGFFGTPIRISVRERKEKGRK